jgi:hypothetical protein
MALFPRNHSRYIAVLAICGLLSGCTANQQMPGAGWFDQTPAVDEASLSPAQRKMRERTAALNRTVWQGMAAGAVAGGAAGAAIDHDKPLRGALIGIVSGLFLGGMAGNYVATRQNEAGNSLDALEVMTADVRRKNVEAKEAIAAMQTVVDQDRRQLGTLKAALRGGRITQDQYDQEASVIQADRAEIRKAVASVADQSEVFEESAATFKTQNPGIDTSALDSEVKSLKALSQRMNNIEMVSRELDA